MPSTKLSFFIVEDEKGAQEALNDALGSQPGVEVLGMAGDVESAYEGIVKKEPDALMLDIKLRGGTAFDLLELFIQNDIDFPPVILMTAYMEFEYAQKALNNYRHKIMKILQKPFLGDFESQFEECKDSLTSFYQSKKQRLKDAKKAIYVKQGSVTYRLRLDELDYIEVGGSGTIILVTTDGRNIQIQQTLSNFMESAPSKIVRIHRNNAVNLEKISHINHEDRLLYLKNHSRGLSIGRTYYPAINMLMN